jgi:hypothetical protein
MSEIEGTREGCSRIERDLWRYIDRELSASALAVISAHLSSCASCKDLYLERAREARACREVFADAPFGSAFVRKFRERFKESRLEAGRALLMDPPRRVWKWRSSRALAAAALLVSIPALALTGLLLVRSPPLGTFVAEGKPVRFARAADFERRPVTSGDLKPGDRFEVPHGGRLAVAVAASTGEDSLLRLDGGTVFEVDAGSSRAAFKGRLQFGVVRATVARDAEREEFLLSTPQAAVKVLGTVFALEVRRGGETRLSVEKGRVAFRSAHEFLRRGEEGAGEGDGARVVEAGETWVARGGEPSVFPGDRPAELEASGPASGAAVSGDGAGSPASPREPPAGGVLPGGTPADEDPAEPAPARPGAAPDLDQPTDGGKRSD